MNRTVVRGLFIFTLLVACNCSDYFTPWTVFQKPDLDPNRYPPDLSAAKPLNLGDSISQAYLGEGKVDWYAIQAKKDSTYVLTLYVQFDAEYMIIKSGDFSFISSGTVSYNGSHTVIWTCDTADTVYLKVSGAYLSDSGSYRLTLKTFQEVYGNSIDRYEPDSKDNRQEIYATYPGYMETYTIRTLTHGDTDWFYISDYTSGTYTIRTVGNTDTKIGLLAVSGDSVIATDDNSGGGMNAKLSFYSSYYYHMFFVTGGTAAASGAYGILVRYSYN